MLDNKIVDFVISLVFIGNRRHSFSSCIDIEPAYNHTKKHVTTKGEILRLDADCEVFDEERILETKTV
jgi:hypothetical protein